LKECDGGAKSRYKCLTGCIDYVTEKCPHKLEKFDAIRDKKLFSDNKVKKADILRKLLQSSNQKGCGDKIRRRAPTGSDRKLLNQEYPITEVTDADLTVECGVEKSRPPYSPCLARKVVDDVFRSCCQQHVPETCHQLCTYEHREHVAAETLIAAVQQGGCDTWLLYFTVQIKTATIVNVASSSEWQVPNSACLRMCNVAPSGDRVGIVEKSDLVCLSNWNVIMYCARSGLRTFN
uniref:DB domain-containing protein n=1 Tax=Angiostrongylus cantonensis TaxID=6313 RepID=A0A0K0CV61_ANGCA